MHIHSPAFADGAPIPERFTCDGADVSPELRFDVDVAAQSLALIVDDPDAPGGSWVHWVVYNLPATAPGLAEAVGSSHRPGGGRAGTNSWGRGGWGGPCPPSGRHRYFFTIYALDVELPDLGAATREELLRAMTGHIVGKAQLLGTCLRPRAAT